MENILEKRKDLILVIISSVLCGIAFTFDSLSIVMWVALIPFLYAFMNSRNSYREIFKKGFVFGSTYYLIILHWIFNLYPLEWIDIGKIGSIAILIGGWIAISLIEGAVFGVVLGLFKFVRCKNNIINILSIASLWVVIEWMQGIGILGFPWGKLAVSQVSILPIVQSVSILGSLFIGFLIVIVNGLITVTITKKSEYKYLVIAILIFIVNFTFGIYKIKDINNEKKVSVAVIQGNILTAQKWKSGASQEHFNIYQELTNEAIKANNNNTEIVFWPETAIPVSITYGKWLADEYENLAKKNNVSFITGAFYTEKGEVIKDYNSVYYVNEQGEVGEKYFKRHLVPFGEVLPFKDVIYKILPILKEINLFNSDLFAGEEATVISTKNGKIGSAICFESIFPNLLRESVNNGAEALFIATNDSWFKDSKAVYQHHNNAILRAIENNRYVVRAANTGISSVINNRGVVENKIEPLKRDYLNSKISFINEKSIYSVLGDIILIFAVFQLVIFWVIKKIK